MWIVIIPPQEIKNGLSPAEPSINRRMQPLATFVRRWLLDAARALKPKPREPEPDHAWTQPKNDWRRMSRRHAGRLWRDACLHGARGLAAYLCRDGTAQHENRARALSWRKIRGLYGRRLCPRQRQARHLHGAGDRRAQSRRRPARCLS